MSRNGPGRKYAPGWCHGTSRIVLMSLAGTLLSSAACAFVHPDALRPAAGFASRALDATAQLHCLALNVYHEARSESDQGKFAVAQVTLNRVQSARYPSTICEVVWQRRQFSWTRDGRSDRPRNRVAWHHALWVATLARDFNPLNRVGRATHYHADYVQPMWASAHRRIRQIGRHIFYEALKYS